MSKLSTKRTSCFKESIYVPMYQLRQAKIDMVLALGILESPNHKGYLKVPEDERGIHLARYDHFTDAQVRWDKYTNIKNRHLKHIGDMDVSKSESTL